MSIRLRPRFAEDALGVLRDAAAEGDGDIAPVRIGPVTGVVVSSPGLMREVLVQRATDFSKGRRQLSALRPVLGYGLLTSEGELHDRQRKLVQPSFVPARMDEYIDDIFEEAAGAVRRWPRGEVDVVPLLNTLAMDIVGRMLFGTSMRDEGTLAEAIRIAFEWEMRALTSLTPTVAWLPTRRNRAMRRAVAGVDRRLTELVAGGRGGWPAEGIPPLLHRLMAGHDADGLPMTADQLYDEVRTIWGAAHETSADAQTWCLDLVARHPEVQERLAEESRQALGVHGWTRDTLHRTSYALQVFKEAMRLYPPAAVMLRAPARSTTLGRIRLKAGTPVFLSPYLMHRRADLFEDPDRFDPERFSPEREVAIPRHAYLPFGAGRRVCIGGYLALLEGQALTTLLVHQLRIAPVTPQPPREELIINLRPDGPVRLRVSDRAPAREAVAAATGGG